MASFIVVCLCLLMAWPQCQGELEEKYDDGTVGYVPRKMPWSEVEKQVDRFFEEQNQGKDPRIPLPPIFPGPEYAPGDILNKVDFENINEALTDVLKAGSLMEGDRVAVGHAFEEGIGVQNNPAYWLQDGISHSSLPPEIARRETALLLFSKRSLWLEGTSGIYTYDIGGTDDKVAVMWQVPYASLLYDRFFNMKIYPQSFETDKTMFKQMFEYAGPWKAGSYEYRTEFGTILTGTMSDSDHSKVIIWSDTLEHGTTNTPELHTACAYNALGFGKYCWQECHPEGWCWTSRNCNSDESCVGPYDCNSKC